MAQQPLRREIFKIFGKRDNLIWGDLAFYWGGGGGVRGLDNSLETIRWLNTLLKCSIRKIFVMKNVLQITAGKERFRFYIFYCLKN